MLEVRQQSAVIAHGAEFSVVAADGAERLSVVAAADSAVLASFKGERSPRGDGVLLLGERSAHNLDALRQHLDWLQPRPLGLVTSVGFGDRLGLATPGHIHALRAVGGHLAPIFAQQSIREMSRSGRSPREVVDDATWGAFAEGWRDGLGWDADHLKTAEDVELCLPIGYTFWTIDPGDVVNVAAETASADALRAGLAELPWQDLEDSSEACLRRYVGQSFDLGDQRLTMEETAAARAMVKYGPAVALTSRLFRLLQERLGPAGWEMEVAVDETQPVTSYLEHIYFIKELQRLGVQFVSFAPRYLGEFEKGVDYMGDLGELERWLAVHAAIARSLGPYKLSLHSGSDKFSIYELAARQTRGLVHLKTAGTSYVEALRTVAELDPTFFRQLYAFARQEFPVARVGYHISATLERTPLPESVADADLPGLLDAFDARQLLHVTYGQVLLEPTLRQRLLAILRGQPQAYAATLETHFVRHLQPFAGAPA